MFAQRAPRLTVDNDARQILRAAGCVEYDSADVILVYFRAADFMSQGVKNVTPEHVDTVGVHGQHISVFEHVPKCADVGGMAPQEYPLRFRRQWWISDYHVLRL